MTARSVGIVGAGPAGTMAALEAARLGADVTLFDTNATVGRKLLVTGNGRCNISNQHAAATKYTCTDQAFLETAFSLWGHHETVARLRDLGRAHALRDVISIHHSIFPSGAGCTMVTKIPAPGRAGQV